VLVAAGKLEEARQRFEQSHQILEKLAKDTRVLPTSCRCERSASSSWAMCCWQPGTGGGRAALRSVPSDSREAGQGQSEFRRLSAHVSVSSTSWEMCCCSGKLDDRASATSSSHQIERKLAKNNPSSAGAQAM